MIDRKNGPEGDLPAFDGVGRTYVIASTPRTGSTLLCRALWGTGLAGAPAEYLNPMQVRDWEVRMGSFGSRWRHRPLRGPLLGLVGRTRWSDDRLRDHLHRVQARRTSANGWFGLKVHFHHFARWFLDERRDPAEFLGPITWVRLVREDRLGQAMSWARAVQTGQWAAFQRPWMPPLYRRGAIAGYLDRIAREEAAWDAFLAGRPVLRLSYESVIGDLTGTARSVLGHLGVPGSAQVAIPQPDFAQQADETSVLWRTRFQAGLRGPVRNA